MDTHTRCAPIPQDRLSISLLVPFKVVVPLTTLTPSLVSTYTKASPSFQDYRYHGGAPVPLDL